MKLKAILKKFKPLHWINNILHYTSLRHNREAYRKYGVGKSLFSSISSRDFPDKTSRAWLDTGDSAACVQEIEAFAGFS
jgi:hypothetical protein